jgi:hypothetical protein
VQLCSVLGHARKTGLEHDNMFTPDGFIFLFFIYISYAVSPTPYVSRTVVSGICADKQRTLGASYAAQDGSENPASYITLAPVTTFHIIDAAVT